MAASRKAYPSDLSDEQWALLEPLIPAVAEDAQHVIYERREIVNAIFYELRSGCPWRLLPHDLPVWSTVYGTLRDRLNALTRKTHAFAKRDATWDALVGLQLFDLFARAQAPNCLTTG